MRLLNRTTLLILAGSALTLAAQTAAPAPAPATPRLSIYGIVDAYASSTYAGGLPGHSSVTSLDSGGYSADRIGFLGSEDIGWGLRANIDLENGFMEDSGGLADGPSATKGVLAPASGSTTTNTTSRLFNRQCWGGVSGNFGEFRFGRQNTILQTQLGNTDPFNGATYASFFNNFSGYASRFDNVLMYKSPTFNGVALQFQFAPGELSSNKTGLNLYVTSIEYTSGGLYLLYNYQMQKSATAAFNVSSSFTAATYDFGKAKVYGAFYRGNNIGSSIGVVNGSTAPINVAGGTAPQVASNFNETPGTWYDGYSLTALYHVNSIVSLGGGYGWAKDMSRLTHNNVEEPSLIATADLSKKFMVYSTWGRMANKNNAAFMLQAAGPIENKNTPAAGHSETGFQIGFRYLFGGALL